MRKLTAGLIALLVVALPVVAGAANEAPPTVQLEIDVGGDTFSDTTGRTIRTIPGEPIVLRVHVFEEGEPGSPVAVEDTSALLGISEASGVGAEVRFADMAEVGDGIYETSYTFPQAREYVIEVLPDVSNRSLLTPETTDQVTVIVDPSVEAAPTGPLWPTLIATFALIAVVGVFVVQATRGKRRVPKEPVHHDSWWNAP